MVAIKNIVFVLAPPANVTRQDHLWENEQHLLIAHENWYHFAIGSNSYIKTLHAFSAWTHAGGDSSNCCLSLGITTLDPTHGSLLPPAFPHHPLEGS